MGGKKKKELIQQCTSINLHILYSSTCIHKLRKAPCTSICANKSCLVLPKAYLDYVSSAEVTKLTISAHIANCLLWI